MHEKRDLYSICIKSYNKFINLASFTYWESLSYLISFVNIPFISNLKNFYLLLTYECNKNIFFILVSVFTYTSFAQHINSFIILSFYPRALKDFECQTMETFKKLVLYQ